MMERDCFVARNTSIQGYVDKAKATTSQLARQKNLDAKAFRAQIIWHQEDRVFSISRLSFQFNNNIAEAFEIADRVTEKSLVEE